ncbi:hypothetical protein B0J11DRAFT_537743 [Dendryphion nanum]|uniref:Uncharacterized protein n=1 Tax=Dendryphion nanum TaxID=256645 RepID=A0A9P9IDK6_9PLEO|nr:hypothetical protein B0J11DRAFT_537743 [Dendryphion nanum]
MVLSSITINATQWMLAHPKTIFSVAAAPAAVVLAPVALAAVGFGAGGVVAGSVAAGMQAGIGNVAAGSAFAILQSAGAGGAGIVIVQGVAGGLTAAGAAVLNSPDIIKAIKKDDKQNKE